VDPLLLVSALLVAAVLALVLAIRYYQDRLARLQDDLDASHAARRRLASATQRLSDWAPFLARWPLDPRNLRFVGDPVDAVSFEADRVVFVEFTTPDRAPRDVARLRETVRAGRVEWLEFPLDEPAPAPAPYAAAPVLDQPPP
jgi:predicted Holliday junction resolvase-like endonuclease